MFNRFLGFEIICTIILGSAFSLFDTEIISTIMLSVYQMNELSIPFYILPIMGAWFISVVWFIAHIYSYTVHKTFDKHSGYQLVEVLYTANQIYILITLFSIFDFKNVLVVQLSEHGIIAVFGLFVITNIFTIFTDYSISKKTIK